MKVLLSLRVFYVKDVFAVLMLFMVYKVFNTLKENIKMSEIQLRDYQKECLDTVVSQFLEGVDRQLVILPTGSGKTVVMAAIAKQLNKKVLLIAHREELIQQASDKFKLFWPEVCLGICMAE